MNRGRKHERVYVHSLGCHSTWDRAGTASPAEGQALGGIALKRTMRSKEHDSREHQGLEQTVTSQPLSKPSASSFTWPLTPHVQEAPSDLELCRAVEDHRIIEA